MNNSTNHVCGTCPSGEMTVISANVEGLSANKASILSELCKIQHCHCLCLQETHQDKARPNIPGMTIVAERPHNKHGSSVFVRDGLRVNSISVCEEENVEFITVELPVVVHSLYKPPPEPFLLHPLGQRTKPHIVIGDFNSHSTLWGYTTTDSDGEAVELQTTRVYKRWSCHSGLKLLCKLCRTFPPPAMWARFTVFWHAGHADPLDGWRCCSHKRMMSRQIQVRQL